MIETLAGVGFTFLLGLLGWIVRELASLRNDIIEVKAQHQNNGGSTLRDAVDRIERKQDEQGQRVTDHLIEAAEMRTEFRAHLASHTPTVVVQQNPPPNPPASS